MDEIKKLPLSRAGLLKKKENLHIIQAYSFLGEPTIV